MFRYLITIVALAAGSQHVMAQSIVARAESTELRWSNGEIRPRVMRDGQSHVTHLLLNGMQLSAQDFQEIAALDQLRALVLFGTNVTDEDVQVLAGCRTLEHLNLTGTEVTDKSIDSVLRLRQLESICLGDVRITPAAIERLKELNRAEDRHLRWGYSQRKD